MDRKKRIPGDQPFAWPKAEEASHAVREYLAALDAARSDEDCGGDGGESSEGGYRRRPAKEVSLTDPQATWVARPGLDPFFAYDANYLIDNKVGIILDAVGTRANRAVEIAITQTMVDRVERRFDCPATSMPTTGSPVSMIERTISSTESASAGTQSLTERPR